MAKRDIASLIFARVYPCLVAKAERKGRTSDEVDEIICWLTGYDREGLAAQIARGVDYRTFFSEAPCLNPDRRKVTGVICGIRVEDIEDPVERDARILNKMVDELAKGKSMDRILRKQ